ncbi:RING/U-box superfamily protein [Prunus dulcis]|uniref:RING/U-box superfamily protein n=1 Tax=Prunus dulcis TaxID=3755 RepID=A0A4Y1QQ34_PRUDU|nr:RING/U-box superfamily protein [Prunus dulcis]
MKLVYTDGRPTISTHGRKATIRDFYSVILPSLQRLHGDLGELDDAKEGYPSMESSGKKMIRGDGSLVNAELEREEENRKSESCPFCRGNIKRVNSQDLWVLTCNEDVVDTETVSKEDLLRFYLYINSLPKDYPDALFLKTKNGVQIEKSLLSNVNRSRKFSEASHHRISICSCAAFREPLDFH